MFQDIAREIAKVKIDPQARMKIMRTPHGNLYVRGEMIRIPRCSALLEDFAPGAHFAWTFSFDEFHYILAGKAEVTYSLINDLYNKKTTMTVEPGDAYLIPCGAHVEWKVDPSGPLQKLCVWMPGSPAREMPPGTTGFVDDYEG
ncbi:MAG: cupin domain-containing protein [Chloroflexi bacterium]|nr:cupin domain-containing protein [Chloroflexota bacterium]